MTWRAIERFSAVEQETLGGARSGTAFLYHRADSAGWETVMQVGVVRVNIY